jgi:hypothetical protein
MLSNRQFLCLNALAAVALLLVVANAVLFTVNRRDQAELSQRQQFIQQTVPLEALYRDIVRSLADLAVKANDRAVLNMLGSQGIGVSIDAPAPAESDAATSRKGQK